MNYDVKDRLTPYNINNGFYNFVQSMYAFTIEGYEHHIPCHIWINVLDDGDIVNNQESKDGVQLDYIGDLIGQPRKLARETMGHIVMRDDETYKQVLRWRMLSLSSGGTVYDITRAVNEIFKPDWFRITELGRANIRLEMAGAAVAQELYMNPKRWVNKAAGVGLNEFYYYDGPFFDFEEKSALNDNLERGGFQEQQQDPVPFVDYYNLVR